MIRFLAKRRLNYIDVVATVFTVGAVRGGHYWLAFAVFLVGLVVSALVEAAAASQTQEQG